MSNPSKRSYLETGVVLGWITGLPTFIAAYIYCIATYGFLFGLGLGLGWLPSGILAASVGGLTVFLWGPTIVVACVVVVFIVFLILR
jgi:hypothetical protein